MAGLRERWNDLVPDAGALADDLVGRYADTTRRAYRHRYLEIILTAVDALDQLSTDPTEVWLAAWFHRAVHQPGAEPSEDAEASAQLAEELLPTYGVSPARTTEVARLVRLTGATPEPATPTTSLQDPNGDVLLDAVNAMLADEQYRAHASEVRREAPDLDLKQRSDEVRALLAVPIYRTQLGQDRFGEAARANLAAELADLDGLLPAPWRGWQRAALVMTAVLTAVLAFMLAFAAARVPWRIPAYSEDSVWPAVIQAVLATPRIDPTANLVILTSCPTAAEAQTHTVTTAIDAATGRTAWTATTRLNYGQPQAVTSDGRVIFGGDDRDGCRLTSISEHGVNERLLARPIKCDLGVAAVDNLVLVRTEDSIIALR